MSLETYKQKRKFDKTPEPKGTVHAGAKKLAFVVQKHRATQLHYDFRLEVGGVLKSWAVPKGPVMDPAVRHMAIMVEDHPYEYRTFEGVIPNGNYGAGEVIVWDEGWYEPYMVKGYTERDMIKGLKAGHITFILHGKKLKGEFALVRLQRAGPKAWLFLKADDDYALKSDITKKDRSVRSGKKLEDLKHHE